MLKIYWSEFYETYLFLQDGVLLLRTRDCNIVMGCSDFSQLEFICEVTDETQKI